MTKARALELNLELLRARFYVDPESPSGLRMKARNGSQNPKVIRQAGDPAGFKNMYGYWEVGIGQVYLKVHRIVWILLRGEILDGLEVDHRDGDNSNNRPDNLQLLTGGANSRARNKLYACNKTGFVGVYPRPNNSWQAAIVREGKRLHLGSFSTAIAAARRFNESARAWASEHGETPRYLNPV